MANKQRLQKGTRAFAGGGLIDSFNKRQTDWDANAAAGGGVSALPETQSVAQTMAEGQNMFDAALGRPSSLAQTTLDDIVGNSNLSGRQKASAAMTLNNNGGALDTSGIRGLSARQNMGLTVDQFNANASMRRRQPLVQAAFADGGVPSETPDQLMARMSAKYGVPAAAPAPVAPSGPMSSAVSKMAPAPQPVVRQPQGIVGLMRNRAAQIDQAAGYAQGGKPRGLVQTVMGDPYAEAEAEGARIVGPGTATSDSIPAVVGGTGEPIRVANGERIVSVAQDHALEGHARSMGFDSLDDFLHALTGKPVGPTVREGQRAAANGLDTNGQYHLMNTDSRSTNDQAAGYDQNNLEARGLQLLQRNTGAGDPDMVFKGMRTTRQADTQAPMTTWNANTDAAAQTISRMSDGSYIKPEDGTGTISFRQGNGSYKNVVLDRPQYTAADGSTTNDWSKTAQYAQGVAQAQKDRDTLAMMQRNRLEREAYGADITDPHVQASAREQIAQLDTKAAKQSQTQMQMLENRIKMNRLAADGQMQELQSQYLSETDPARREALAERIRGVNGRSTAPQPAQLQHIETENGVMAFNPRTGTAQPVIGADGQAIKGGGKPLTEFQGKSTGFGMRAANASQIIENIGDNGAVQPSLLKRAAESIPLVGEGLGTMLNGIQSPKQQQIEQAQRDFVNATLRQESGAAISASEFENAKKQYFPQPGDSKEVIAQKKVNRELAVRGFQISAGPGGKNIGSGQVQQAQQSNPVLSEARAAIAAGASRDAVIKRLKENGVTDLGGL